MVTLVSLLVEMKCPEHGLERFKIKIVRRFNVKPDTITPKFRTRPTTGDLSGLLVGRNVSHKQIQSYLHDYFRRKGMMEAILGMRLVI